MGGESEVEDYAETRSVAIPAITAVKRPWRLTIVVADRPAGAVWGAVDMERNILRALRGTGLLDRYA